VPGCEVEIEPDAEAVARIDATYHVEPDCVPTRRQLTTDAGRPAVDRGDIDNACDCRALDGKDAYCRLVDIPESVGSLAARRDEGDDQEQGDDAPLARLQGSARRHDVDRLSTSGSSTTATGNVG
jgi:hypothetical protein